MRRVWTKEMINKLRKDVKKYTYSDLEVLWGMKATVLKSAASNYGLCVGHGNKKWPTKKQDKLIKLYATNPNIVISKKMGISEGAVMARAFKLGLKKDPEWLKNQGKKFWFKKGHQPWNQGTKGLMNITEKAKASMFKKGIRPVNSYDGNGVVVFRRSKKSEAKSESYYYIKISDQKWEPLHRHIWEQKYRLIPNGMMLVFKDGNTRRCVIENLELITRAENMKRNSGVANLPDSMVAYYLSVKSRKVDLALKEELLKHPKLLDIKRNEFKLKRLIKEKKYG